MSIVTVYLRLLKVVLNPKCGFVLNKFVVWFMKQITEIEKNELRLSSNFNKAKMFSGVVGFTTSIS
jgi:hypothetical protein